MSRRALLACAIALALGSCGRGDPDQVNARDYDSFWLWAGVTSRPELRQARTLYLLYGEVLSPDGARLSPLRPGIPRLPDQQVWLVVRTDTLDWQPGAYGAMLGQLEAWRRNGNKIAGVQIDFDARTRQLGRYADFLREVRRILPAQYLLSITGLMDWSANGDPRALAALKGVVDEVVIQTYQGRSTIFGYDRYFQRMHGFPIPFKVGLVEHGRWIEPAGLSAEPNFKGYVVFLLAQRRSR